MNEHLFFLTREVTSDLKISSCRGYHKMCVRRMALAGAFVSFLSGASYATEWQSSPYNWQNSPYNWQNSPYNWQNSPNNWQNSPQRFGNDRIIRDQDGQPQGYMVPRQDGGLNFFDFQGNRQGYVPSPQQRRW
jgi:hypothetical protein